MRMRLVVARAAWLGVSLGVSAALAQKNPEPPPPKPQAHPPKPPPGQAPRNNPQAANNPQVRPAKELERFLNMPEEDRQKALAKLPAQQRLRMQRQIENLEKLPPDQRLR